MSDANPDPEVAGAVADLLQTVEESMQLAKTASEQLSASQVELANWKKRAELAEAKSIELEKVASKRAAAPAPTPTTFNEEAIQGAVGALIDLSYLTPSEGVKLASMMRNDPNVALTAFASALKLSSPFHEGAGYPKRASTVEAESDPDGWGKVITESRRQAA